MCDCFFVKIQWLSYAFGQYVALIGLTILVWDHLMTFEDEVGVPLMALLLYKCPLKLIRSVTCGAGERAFVCN